MVEDWTAADRPNPPILHHCRRLLLGGMQYAIETDPRSVQWPKVLQGLFLLWIFMDTEETTELAPSKLNNKHTTFRPNSKCSGA